MALPELVLPKETARALRHLTGESRPDVALLLVMRDARAYRLEKIQAEIEGFEAKYGMTFEAWCPLHEQDESEEAYSWEVERDFFEWDGLVTRKAHLESAPVD
ncbi:MAG: hypothetical protein ACYC5O_23705 [Anaerolineae bacterium]